MEFEKYSNPKFNENPFRGSQIVPYGQADGPTDGHTGRHDVLNRHF
jgi:hypothetical protein